MRGPQSLGSVITADGEVDKEIDHRTQKARTLFAAMWRTVLGNRQLAPRAKGAIKIRGRGRPVHHDGAGSSHRTGVASMGVHSEGDLKLRLPDMSFGEGVCRACVQKLLVHTSETWTPPKKLTSRLCTT